MEFTRKRVTVNLNQASNEYDYSIKLIIIFAIVLIIVSGFRYGFVDTPTYRHLYEKAYNWNYIISPESNVETGFRFFMYILNRISIDSQLLIFISAFIINVLYIKTIFKYSSDIPFSLYLYFTLVFIGTNNGIRQILVASILAASFELISKKKTLQLIILVLLLSTFHTSVLIIIPFYFIIREKQFNPGVILFLLFAISGLILPSGVFTIIKTFLGESDYIGYLSLENRGMNFIRLIVSAVPCLLALIYFIKKKKCYDEPQFDMFVNMILIDLGFMILAIKMLYFARVGMYFSFFNIILLPSLLQKLFGNGKDYSIIKIITAVLYGIYFTYQIFAYGEYINSFRLIF
jgi:transmembrane protein EpsG